RPPLANPPPERGGHRLPAPRAHRARHRDLAERGELRAREAGPRHVRPAPARGHHRATARRLRDARPRPYHGRAGGGERTAREGPAAGRRGGGLVPPAFERLAVLGLGLLGGSVAWAARERGVARVVVGCGRRPEPLRAAPSGGLVGRFTTGPADE